MGCQLDILAPGLDVVFCGFNPTAKIAASGHNFSNRSHHFWSLLHLAGFTDVQLAPRDEQKLLEYGCGITTVVTRPTTRPFEIQAEEFTQAWPGFEAKIRRYAPKCIAFLGKRTLLLALGERDVPWGRQQLNFAETESWVLPNPRGPNSTFSLEELVKIYADFRDAVSWSERNDVAA